MSVAKKRQGSAGQKRSRTLPPAEEARRRRPVAAQAVASPWWLLLPALAFVVWVIALNCQPITNNDFWIHLRIGEDILHTGQVPRVDDYSAVARGLPFIAHEWLGEVVVAGLVGTLGQNGPMLLCLAAALALLALLFFSLEKALRRSPLVAPTLALAVYLVSWRISGRPDLFTMLLVAAFVFSIERWRRIRRLGVLAWVIPLTVLWVNLHGGYLLGIGLLWGLAGCVVAAAALPGLQGSEAPYSWRDASCAMGVALAASVVTIVNPYGIELLEHTLRMSRGQDFELMRRIVTEWQPPFAADSYFRQNFPYLSAAFAVQLALLWTVLLLRLPTRPLFDVFFAGVVTWLGVDANRFLAFAAIVGFPIIVRHGEALLAAGLGRRWRDWRSSPLRCVAESGLFIALLVATVQYGYLLGPTRSKPLGWGYGGRRPLAEVEYIRNRGLTGNLYNEIMTDGSYVVHELYPAVRPVMDARVDLVGDERYGAYQDTRNSVRALDAYLERYDVQLAIVKRDGWMVGHLQRDGAWEILATSSERSLLRRRAGAD